MSLIGNRERIHYEVGKCTWYNYKTSALTYLIATIQGLKDPRLKILKYLKYKIKLYSDTRERYKIKYTYIYICVGGWGYIYIHILYMQYIHIQKIIINQI